MNTQVRYCKYCKKEIFLVNPRSYNRRKFCDKKCADLFRSPPKDYPEKKCRICDKIFKPTISYQLNCSTKCKERWKNSNRRKAKEQFLLKEKIGQCEYCGYKIKLGLITHHIKGRENTDIMVLCGSCHMVFHKVRGRNYPSENSTKEEVFGVLREYIPTALSIDISNKANSTHDNNF